MRATTVRFDEDSWLDLCREADRLGVARAQYIREATQARVARAAVAVELRELEGRVARLERAVVVVVGMLRRARRRRLAAT
jgi:hypothetical protein